MTADPIPKSSLSHPAGVVLFIALWALKRFPWIDFWLEKYTSNHGCFE